MKKKTRGEDTVFVNKMPVIAHIKNLQCEHVKYHSAKRTKWLAKNTLNVIFLFLFGALKLSRNTLMREGKKEISIA